MADFNLAEAIVKFAACTETNWNGFNIPIPENVVIITADTKKFKRGDGIHLYSELPDGPSIAGISSGEESISNVLTQLTTLNEDDIIIINNEIYSASGTKLTTLSNRINTIENKDVIQDANLDAIVNQFGMSSTLTNADNGKLAIVTGHKLAPGPLLSDFLVVTPPKPLHILSFDIYSDRACTIKTDELYYRSSYYAYIEASHDDIDIDNLMYSLTCDLNNNITITQVERGLFKIDIAYPQGVLNIQFNITLSYNADIVQTNKTVVLNPFVQTIMAIYGGTAEDRFQSISVDSQNNIVCVGYTLSEGTATNALVVKFDQQINILARKHYGGSAADYFYDVIVDSNDNIICVGYTASEGSGGDALIVKFDSSLNIIARKRYGGSGAEYFYSVVINTNGDIICAGSTTSEGSGGVALVVKFDSSLNIVARKRYGGSGEDRFNGVIVDSNDNIICAGYTNSEGLGSYEALVVKFDSSLNIINHKRYGGASSEKFQNITVDLSDNIICVGYTQSEGLGSWECLVIKFDNSLNMLIGKRYGGTTEDSFQGVAVDSHNNIICAGYAFSDSFGSYDNIIVKFDSNLNVIFHKKYGGISADQFQGIVLDSFDNMICCGYSQSEGMGSWDCTIIKFSPNIPAGLYIGTVLTNMTLADSRLTLADSTLTLANSTLTSTDSNLTLADSALTLADSNLTLEKDTLNI